MESQPVKLLLVEDNPGDARYLWHLLHEAGVDRFELTHLDRLDAALKYLADHQTDLILLDLSLPDAQGLETVRRVRAGFPDVPIVVLTGFNDEAFALQAVREGAQDYLFKSQIETILLVRSIRYAIERQRLLQERKKAEKALKASEEFALNIIDSSLDIIIAVDNERRLIEFNRAAEHAFGYRRDEVLGKSVSMLYSREDEGTEIHEVIIESGRCVREVLNRKKNGEVFPCLVSASALRNAHGEVVGVMGISRDITERKQAELALRRVHEQLEMRVQERTAELLKANAALQAEAAERRLIEADLAKARDEALGSARLKAEFLANMSHEIRTPLNGILGMSNLLLKTALEDEQRDYAQTLNQSGAALLKIINDILDFSKIEAGKLTFEVLDFDLVDTVEGTLELLAEPAQAKGVELVADIPPNVPTLLAGDPVRLRQVLTNLVSNAVKFTEHGEVLVQIRNEAESETEIVLRVSVRDTGIGVAPGAQSRLFQAFSQADGSTTRKYGGTGLGLVISKQLVTLMGGDIGVQSEEGRGSTFWFTARLRKQRPGQPSSEAVDPTCDNGRVLIFEPVQTTRMLLQQQLAVLGFETASAGTARQAIEALRAEALKNSPFKLLLLDVTNSQPENLAVAREIRLDPKINNTPVVFLITMRQRLQLPASCKNDADALLVKPVRQSRLSDCIANLCRPGQQLKQTVVTSTDVNHHTSDERPPVEYPTRVLVAEDNPINQKVAVGQLHEIGYGADVAENGIEVLNALRKQRYDVILMDCQMPEMDGYETTQRIRRAVGDISASRGVYIIAMTANAMQGAREKCLAAGMNDYISKPIQEEDLKAVLDRWRSVKADTRPAYETTPPHSSTEARARARKFLQRHAIQSISNG
jgi:two-component system, sensor histidine kinase and response regulator